MLPPATRHKSPATDRRPAATPSLSFQVSVLSPPRKRSAFTLIELLVVIAIIAILAGLAFPAVQGALGSARKAEVRGMANQIKLAISSYYAEYGTYPTNTRTDANFVNAMTGGTNVPSIPNRRGIRFLEVPGKFTNAKGIFTPRGFGTTNVVFEIETDAMSKDGRKPYDGKITLPTGVVTSGSVAVWVRQNNQFIGTW